MRKCAALLALLFALPLAAQTAAERIEQAIGFYDAGKYDDAIAIYKSVIAEEPGNELAVYELGLTYSTKGDFAACRALLEPRAGRPGRLQAQMLAILGNCLDGAGEADRAIATYRKGLKLAPNDDQLLYNLAVSLSSRQQYDEARELLKRELRVRPDHASGHLGLAQIFAAQNFRAAAIAEYLRFLALEPQGPRSKPAAEALLGLLNLGVEQQDEKNISVAIDTQAPKGEGDYGPFEMAMAIVSGGRFTEDQKKLTEFERTRTQIVTVLNMLLETAEGSNYTADVNVPYFAELQKKKQLDQLAGIVLLSLDLPGQAEWQKKNLK